MKLQLNIVAWNGMEVIPALLASIATQTYKDFRVLLIDNGSIDHVESFVRQNYPDVAYLRNVRNLGFAQAHNQGIRYALDHWKDEDLSQCFVLLVNQDTVWTPTFLEELMKAASAQPDGAAWTGKLLRMTLTKEETQDHKTSVPTNIIDSTGLRGRKNRVFSERGSGEEDTGQYDTQCELFGISAALGLYRASALKDVRFEDEYLDADFVTYKEDVDLAWRLQARGYHAYYVPTAVAYHYRGAGGNERANWRQLIANRRKKQAFRSWYSTRNHLLLLMKHETTYSLIKDGWRIAWMEFRRFLYVCLFETRHITAYFSAWKLRKQMHKKSTHLSKQNWQRIRAFFV